MTTGPQPTDGRAENPLARRFTPGSLLRFAFPTMLMMVFSGVYTTVDTVFISRFVGTNALSSLNIVTPVINLLVGLGTMLATGSSAIVARKMGGGEEGAARQDFTLITLAAVLLGLAFTALGLSFLDQIVRGLGASALLFPDARDYLSLLLKFAPASMLQVLFTGLFVTAGRPGLGMAAAVAAGLFNMVFDYVFIVPLGMGIRGAALATGMAHLIPAVTGLIFFLQNKTGALWFARPRSRLSVLWESCLNGSSELVSQLSTAVTTFCFNAAMMSRLGEDGVAAVTIMIYSQFLLTALFIGFSMGVAPVISYHYGGRDGVRLRRVVRICLCTVGAISALVFSAAMLGGPRLIHIFSPRGTPVYEIARRGFRIFPFSFLLCGFNLFASALFTALSNGVVSAAISFLRTFVFLLAGILLLPRVLEVSGIWLAVPLAELLTLVAAVILIFRYRGRYSYL